MAKRIAGEESKMAMEKIEKREMDLPMERSIARGALQSQDTQCTAQRTTQCQYPQSRRAKGDAVPWERIRLAYITRPDRPSFYRLEMEFGLGDKTVQRRGKREGWGQKRDDHHNGVVTEAQKKVGEKQITDLAKTIEMLNGLLERLNWELDGAKAHSLEGIAREIRETIKMLNMYILDRQAERNKLTEAETKKLDEVLGRIEEKAPEEYAELKEIYEEKSD